MSKGTIVGALACQRDSYLKTLETIVLKCTPVEVKQEAEGKKKKGKKVENAVPAQELYEVELEDTILFPEGGGQPSDRGIISLADELINVLDVQRKQLRAIHITDKPIKELSQVKVQLDWRRRLDHMQQHTGQHLLSAILDKYELPTLSWNMGDLINYIEIPRKLTDDEIEKVSLEINDQILNNIMVNIEVSNQDGNTDAINEEKGVMRIVKIGELDNNPCCGTHLSSVGQIKAVSLLGQVNGKNGTSKLNFITGDRVYKYTSQLYSITKKLMNTLNSSFEDLDLKAEFVTNQAKKSQQRERNLNKELATMYSEKILLKFESGSKIEYLFREDGDLEFINKIYSESKEKLNELKATIVLIAGDGAVIVGGGESEIVDNVVDELKKRITTLRGGGKNGRFQGKASTLDKKELNLVEEYIQSL